MAFKRVPLFAPEYNCLVSDLVEGFPPEDRGEPEGSNMYVWDDETKELLYIFRKVFATWYIFRNYTVSEEVIED